jgi:hypothetical protein
MMLFNNSFCLKNMMWPKGALQKGYASMILFSSPV